MPIFTYLTKDLQGVEHKGTIETADEHQASQILSKRGLIIIRIKSAAAERKFFQSFKRNISFDDIVVMTRQLATMVESGLVVSEALDILVAQQNNKRFKEILEAISRDVKSGLDLATAFKKHSDVFSPLYANLISAGEKSGKLDIVLNQTAANLEKDREFRSRIRGALIYPVIVIIMMLSVMLMMMVVVIPRLTSLYSSSNIELPLPTVVLITVSGFLIHFWWLIVITIISSVTLFKRWVATEGGKFTFDSLLLKAPIIGKIVRGAALTNFTRTFGLLTTAGIPILDSLSIISDIINNAVYKSGLQECFKGVERGLPLSTQLEQTGIFPPIVPQMLRVGEETGKVDQVSFKMAEYFESETDHIVKNLTVIIEPVILVALGIGVAFLVLSIILPIYKLTTSFS